MGVTLGVERDRVAYALGDRIPSTVYAPRDAGDVAATLRACEASGTSVVFFGGGTLQAFGNPPHRYDAAIDLRGLDRIAEYEPNDLTIGVEAGVTVATLTATLSAHRQFVPLDAPRASRATVGGTLAAGWLGPRRAGYGRPRDFVIGSTVALADGTLAKSGGMVVKNATGYDLSKLYVGSLGTLGAIVRANLKTLPMPAARRVAIAPLPERTRPRAIANLRALDVEPSAAFVVRGFTSDIDGRDGLDGRAFVLFEGSARAVDRATRELRSALGAAGVPETRLIDRDVEVAFARVLDAYVEPLGDRSVTLRSFGFPGDAGERLGRFAHAATASGLALEAIEDVRTGDAIVRVSSSSAVDFDERLRAFEAERRTTLPGARILAAAARSRSSLDAWADPPQALAKMRALKDRFDPRGTIAPGRYVGGI